MPPGAEPIDATPGFEHPAAGGGHRELEIGMRSDWLDGRLRFNATYFDADWDGMRVTLLPMDALGNTQPFPYMSGDGGGAATAASSRSSMRPTDRLR